VSATAAPPRTPAAARRPLAAALADVQALPLRNPRHRRVMHLLLRFASDRDAQHWLLQLAPQASLSFGPGWAERCDVALGFTAAGLRRLSLPVAVQGLMRRLAPAFMAGAAARSASHLGDSGASGAGCWDEPYRYEQLDAVLTLHGESVLMAQMLAAQQAWFAPEPAQGRPRRGWVHVHQGAPLAAPGQIGLAGGEWVHFGYRDGLTRPVIDPALEPPHAAAPCGDEAPSAIELGPLLDGATSRHAPGELLLGRARDIGDNPWSLTRLPEELRRFFHDGSFGVLRVIEQDVPAFDTEVARWATAWKNDTGSHAADVQVQHFIRAKLCGRWPEGPVVRPGEGPGADIAARLAQADPFAIDFAKDRDGTGCPFASHVRRMNAQAGGGALARPRVLFRRSLPYDGEPDGAGGCSLPGLLGLFFCSSIEEQFEHLVGQWADRMPLGLNDGSRAQDPFIGAHDDAAAPFMLRRVDAASPLRLWGFRPFVRTRGTAYLFYPSRAAFAPLLDPRRWVREAEPWLTR